MVFSDAVRENLCSIIQQYGPSIINNPKRVAGLLQDLCENRYKRDVTVLLTALEEGVATKLANRAKLIPVKLLLRHLAQRLHDDVAMMPEAADWAVESWGIALDAVPTAKFNPNRSPEAPASQRSKLLPKLKTRTALLGLTTLCIVAGWSGWLAFAHTPIPSGVPGLAKTSQPQPAPAPHLAPVPPQKKKPNKTPGTKPK